MRNPQTFVGGGPNFDIDFALLGPDLDVLYKYAEQLRKKAPELGLQDADITLKLDKPELRVEIDRERAAESRRGHPGHRHGVAHHGRRR
jgi:HAE1 family hydrophobic/amphiphilic exporter-1